MLVDPERGSMPDATASVPRIGDLFRIAQRYLRSVHLERDYDNTPALQHYVVTPPIVAVFSRIVEGLRVGAGHRAWRITGDYGTGKSACALMLARLLCEPDTPALQHVYQAMAHERASHGQPPVPIRMLPVLVTGAREPLVPAVARAVGQTLQRLRGQRRSNRSFEELRRHAATVAKTAEASQMLDLLSYLGGYAAQSGRSGVLVVLDELGKFLEYAALHPDQEDVYVLQRLAEVMWLYSTGHTETRNSRSLRGVFDEPTHDKKVPGRI
jgi:hypothetical protein